LVIDDDVAFSEIVYDNIKKHNHFALIANTAKDGLELIKQYKISAILLDLTLPDINGIDVLKEIKSDINTQDIPVYIISSKDRDDETLKAGALGYGQKPLLENDIDEVISELELFIKEQNREIDTNSKYSKIDDIDIDNLNVLIVDDDIKNIFVLDSALNEYNVNVEIAYNGKEAIEKLRENESIDIVLMDIMMPVMDGYEAIETIRADEKLKNIPIIAVTAKAMKEDKEKCMKIGADDFMSKPIDVDALMKLIKVWSDKKHR
jgi:CheY-like chemotaxis protein